MIKWALILLLTAGCISSTEKERQKNKVAAIDTIYSTNPRFDKNFKRPIIKLSSDSTNNLPFNIQIDGKNFINITIDNFNRKYPIYLKKPKNILIEDINNNEGYFYLTPMDSIFYFEIYLDFGVGNVVVKYQDKEGEFGYNAYDSIRPIAKIDQSSL